MTKESLEGDAAVRCQLVVVGEVCTDNLLVNFRVWIVKVKIDVDHALRDRLSARPLEARTVRIRTTSLPSSELPSSWSLCFRLTLVAGTAASFVLAGISMDLVASENLAMRRSCARCESS